MSISLARICSLRLLILPILPLLYQIILNNWRRSESLELPSLSWVGHEIKQPTEYEIKVACICHSSLDLSICQGELLLNLLRKHGPPVWAAGSLLRLINKTEELRGGSFGCFQWILNVGAILIWFTSSIFFFTCHSRVPFCSVHHYKQITINIVFESSMYIDTPENNAYCIGDVKLYLFLIKWHARQWNSKYSA